MTSRALVAVYFLRIRVGLPMRAFLLALGLASTALAAEDVGLVLNVSGEVIFAAREQSPTQVKAYMRLREGDQLSLPKGAGLKLVFFDGGRVETWNGPARFSLNRSASVASVGDPAVTRLPVLGSGAPQLEKIGRFSRAGGIVLRSTAPAAAKVATPDTEALARARAQYNEWVAQAAPDDILPDLYLLAVLQEHRATDEVFTLLGAMERKQPDNPDLKELSRFLRGGP